MKIVDNFLTNDEFENIKNILMGDDFPWYFNDYITDEKDTNNFYFTHLFYNSMDIKSNFFYLFKNFLDKIECKSLLRIKGNLYVSEKEKRKNKDHTDFKYKHKGCLFYINDNNGETYFGDKKVLPKANRAVFFDPSKKHSSSICNNEKRRITINFNYF
tara:strand:- start:1038 stop:1511 length:474 start_codon:yes stop_codon:yes gene_type:complete